MDQTPMPFEMGTDLAYNETGTCTVWVKSLGSGLGQRQATVQLTVHADGIAQTPPKSGMRSGGTLALIDKYIDSFPYICLAGTDNHFALPATASGAVPSGDAVQDAVQATATSDHMSYWHFVLGHTSMINRKLDP